MLLEAPVLDDSHNEGNETRRYRGGVEPWLSSLRCRAL